MRQGQLPLGVLRWELRHAVRAGQDGLLFTGVLPSLSERPLTLMRTHGSTLALQSSILSLSSASCPYPTADSELLLDHVAGWLHLERSAIGLRSIPEADSTDLVLCCACVPCCVHVNQTVASDFYRAHSSLGLMALRAASLQAALSIHWVECLILSM